MMKWPKQYKSQLIKLLPPLSSEVEKDKCHERKLVRLGWMIQMWRKGGLYKKGGVYRKRGSEHMYQSTKKERRRTHRESRVRRVNSNNSYVIEASSGQLVLKKWFFSIIRLAFYSLFFSSGGVPLWLFVSLSYKFIV